MSHVFMCRKSIPGRGDSKCKGQEANACLVILKISKGPRW